MYSSCHLLELSSVSTSAFEFLDSTNMSLVEKHTSLTNPISPQPLYLLIETSGSQESHDQEVCPHSR